MTVPGKNAGKILPKNAPALDDKVRVCNQSQFCYFMGISPSTLLLAEEHKRVVPSSTKRVGKKVLREYNLTTEGKRFLATSTKINRNFPAILALYDEEEAKSLSENGYSPLSPPDVPPRDRTRAAYKQGRGEIPEDFDENYLIELLGREPNNPREIKLKADLISLKTEEMEYHKASGELLPRVEHEAALENIGGMLQQSIMGIPPRVAAQFGEDEQHRVRRILTEEMKKILQDAAHALKQAAQ